VTGVVYRLVWTLLGAHIGITFFHNSPDTRVNAARLLPILTGLPQWRFFAPNPGVEDTLLFFRARSTVGRWGQWQEFRVSPRLPWHGLVWNPGSRAAKVLFDAGQQMVLQVQHGVPFELAPHSEAYRLVKDLVAERVRGSGEVLQFMVALRKPQAADPVGMIRPVLVSLEHLVDRGDATTPE
jgi:hypothetical protein